MTLVNSRMPIMLQAERMQRIEGKMTRIQAQIATGQRFTAPSENPAAANRAALLERLETVVEAQGRVIERARTRLSLSETVIDGASAAMIRLRELALTAANATISAADRIVIATEVRNLREQMLDFANSRDEAGRYIFAGARDSSPAHAAAEEDGPLLWQGAGTGPGAEAAGVRSASTPRGPAVFGRDEDGVFATIDAFLGALDQPDDMLRQEAMDGVLGRFEAGFDTMVTARARIGAALGRLDVETDRLAATKLDIATGLASAKGLDLTEAIAELQALGLTLAASQQAFSQIFRFSLFDRLG
jgi:flagellar hook-associated protein 3 FlgL